MILREWRGRASPTRAGAYPAHFRDNVLPELRQTPGFLGAYLSQRRLDEAIEFLVLTRWRSMEAIRGFAGSDAAKAVVEPGAVAALIEFDATVQHYEVIEDAGSPGA
jgi:heme-degrading monooxygenase HmoA